MPDRAIRVPGVLEDLSDTDIGTLSNNDLMCYDSGTGKKTFKSAATLGLATSGGTPATIDDSAWVMIQMLL